MAARTSGTCRCSSTPKPSTYWTWFHITMRLTVMTNTAQGLRCRPPAADPGQPPPPAGADLATEVCNDLERLKWFLWHGNVFRALQTIEDLAMYLDIENPSPEQRKLGKMVHEFDTHIRANTERIPNYGERHRAGETISSSFVESAVNQVISKRMVKKQQMRWTPRGAHLLLQIRTRVLNDQLADDFHRWYPNFAHKAERHPFVTA